MLLRGLRPDPVFEEEKIGRESVRLGICAWASHQPFLFEADLWKAIGCHAWSAPIQIMPGICPLPGSVL